MSIDIARAAIERPVNTWLIILTCLIGGLWGLSTVGRLEDPAFTIKQALVITPYPGATAEEVELEVTEPLESAIQQLPQIKHITSRSKPGISEIEVEIKDTYDGNTMPQVWDELRRKVGDAQKTLPEGANPSTVNDDFGDVFGIFYAITAPGFSDREILDLAKFLRRELLTVTNVAKVETAGMRTETIYVEVSNARLARFGLPMAEVLNTISSENRIADAGAVTIDDRRIRITTSAGFDSVPAIEALRIGRPGSTEQISLIDLAEIRREPTEIPDHLVHFNGMPAFTLAISGVTDANIVTIGQAVEARLAELAPRIPLGIEIHPIYEQHKVVDQSIDDFIVNLIISVSIVILSLCLMMGWRVGLIVGATLLLTVLGTVFLMRVFHIDMERISLGALIIAMGMLVDNAIVVAEGMLINMQHGMNGKDAATISVKRTQLPLLGATVIGIMAFSGIGLSPDVTGEFLFSLFAVIGMSLLLSWILAITVTPLFGHLFLKVEQTGEDPYRAWVYQAYRKTLTATLKARALTALIMVLLTATCFAGFGLVKQAFFPDANTPLFYIHYQLPQGSDIRSTERDIGEIDAIIRAKPDVVSVASFIGRGASRYMLTYAPEQPNSSYGLFIVRTENLDPIPALAAELKNELNAAYPNAEIRTERLMFGPGGGAKIEARFSGPDSAVLRRLGNEALDIMRADGNLIDLRTNWRQKELVMKPVYSPERARIAGIGLSDLAQALQFASTGIQAGTYREDDKQIPIVVRPPDAERRDAKQLRDRLVWSNADQSYIPIAQIAEHFETVSEDTLIHRRNRVRTLIAQADPLPELTADQAFRRIRAQIEAIPLPSGYRFEWGGEYESSTDAQTALNAQIPVGFVVMLVISILLFGKVRQPLIIWLVVPMSVCGVVIGLLISNQPFSFMALLGLLSLSGMLMKNAIVLVDEIDAQIDEGKHGHAAIVDAGVSRLRPVFLAAGTTILGMIPLLTDAFFASMAVTIMGGLAFATVLTLIAVPVLYALFFGVKAEAAAK
ncbi:efflux RND transporter permease subunit [Methylotuvimicrobium alcaliphilum]|uniref:RND transporter, HAE1/HME family, permease protein n=1 Tax=Methylotuvimicrobium alcaliphilum (strain DSM 19304 / NCIMB 14124 / VKM B-2133 / 20Z) TaxID=1091494 RepID=G4SVN6_META2|nr:efflux RND transporter permease subunit [Methylotuvimicrobium alcaliphilum]CCE24095.1 RND transporter, HAE1/HME family, permease protein [Methylotuvimicrobium alcaliphilum 20Z]